MKPVAARSVSVKSSRRLLLVQSLAHLAAAAAVLASHVPSWLAALLLLLLGASLARLRRLLPVAALMLGGDGRLQTVDADGTASEATVHPHTLVLSFLIVLLYRQHGRLRALTLPGDSLSAEDFRQLRLWLRWRSTAANPA
ncbi:MAG: protein YgfX [Sulfuritalea sp.]|nr:protein YgfX [Sulfuritalea sp.]